MGQALNFSSWIESQLSVSSRIPATSILSHGTIADAKVGQVVQVVQAKRPFYSLLYFLLSFQFFIFYKK